MRSGSRSTRGFLFFGRLMAPRPRRFWAAAFAVTIIACGGGGNRTDERALVTAALRENTHLGMIPAIFAWREAERERLERDNEARVAELVRNNRSGQIAELMKETEEAVERISAEAGDAVTAERAKIVGREVPFSYSEALENSGELFYSVGTLTIVDREIDGVYYPSIAVPISAKAGLGPSGDDHSVNYALINYDGATLDKGSLPPLASTGAGDGEHIRTDTISVDLRRKGTGRQYTDFVGVRFLTRAELAR